MKELVYEQIAEVLVLLGYTIVAGALTVGGVVAEIAGLSNLSAGQLTIGAWEIWMGALGLYAGLYLLGYCELLPRLRERRAGAD